MDFVSNFFWTKKKFWETKKKQAWLWNSNSCDLSLATSAAFQFLSKIMISTKFHISNQIHLGVDDTAFVKKNNIFIEWVIRFF